ncbi:Asp/Glu racemase [uncultured Tateyamaria sp.]|uniref:maleate cis-trans isomerase family protein n=1 Tax=uncultured Tateyamaria sp. TaxID=455651 RepID=UPI002606D26A|nr:Asp/Glu racemase [uncultured Tateyamaria sp.]
MTLPFDLEDDRPLQMGLVALQSDETVERDLRRLLPDTVEYMISRVPSAATVSPDTLRQMADDLTTAAALFPRGANMACVGYGCTSGTAEIGADKIAHLITMGVPTPHVTNPVTALIAACRHLHITRLGLISPYIASVSDRLRHVLALAGIEVTAFASFDEPLEERVVRISTGSIVQAACGLGDADQFDAVFLSCTNLRTLPAIPEIEAALRLPVLSSNLVLAWHMAALAGPGLRPGLPYRLGRAPQDGPMHKS